METVEEKAKYCREFEGKELIEGEKLVAFLSSDENICVLMKTKSIPGVWAIEREGEFYCFMKDKKPSCAGEDSDILEMIYQSAIDSGKITIETGRHYTCKIRNKQYQEKM